MKIRLTLLSISLLTAMSTSTFAADAAPAADKPAGPNPGKQAIAVRKAAYTLIGNSFKPLGDIAQGKAEYNQADVQKRANRILVLSEFLDSAFPEASNLGEPDTKAKADVWTNKADFDKKLKDFQEHAAALVKVAGTEKTASDAYKEAFGNLAKDCKGCHENYKLK